jgi:very-short-patch-repair endonuclease
MFTGFFRDRARAGSVHTAPGALGRLLRSQPLRAFRFDPNCEVGPFIVDFLCRERALIVELERSGAVRQDTRAAFLTGMGYVVIHVSRREVRSSPRKVVRRLRLVLEADPSTGARPAAGNGRPPKGSQG